MECEMNIINCGSKSVITFILHKCGHIIVSDQQQINYQCNTMKYSTIAIKNMFHIDFSQLRTILKQHTSLEVILCIKSPHIILLHSFEISRYGIKCFEVKCNDFKLNVMIFLLKVITVHVVVGGFIISCTFLLLLTCIETQQCLAVTVCLANQY